MVLPGIAQYGHGAIALQHNVLVLPPSLIYRGQSYKSEGLFHQHNLLIETWFELYGVSRIGRGDCRVDGLPAEYPCEAGICANPLPALAHYVHMSLSQTRPLGHARSCECKAGMRAFNINVSTSLIDQLALHRSEPVQAERTEDIGHDIVWQIT